MNFMKRALFLFAAAFAIHAQNTQRWMATTGDQSLSGSGTTATIQQPAANGALVTLEQIVVYCSVACNVSQAANGTAATTTAAQSSITPVLPTATNAQPPFNFFTRSDVGTGTAQGGIYHLAAGQTITFCLAASCLNGRDVVLGGSSTGLNYSVSINSITGTANIAFYVRTQ